MTCELFYLLQERGQGMYNEEKTTGGHMYNITREMMHPQVREIGTLIRSILPYFKESTFRKINKVMLGSPAEYREFEGYYHAFDILAPKSAPAKEAAAFLNERFEYAMQHCFSDQPEHKR